MVRLPLKIECSINAERVTKIQSIDLPEVVTGVLQGECERPDHQTCTAFYI